MVRESPVVYFKPGDPVPTWIEKVTPEHFQFFLRFRSHVEAKVCENHVELRAIERTADCMMEFKPPRNRKPGPIELNGAPTVFVGVDSLSEESD